MAQEGFLYESNAYKALQKYKISTGGTAGASHDKPDLTIKKKTKTIGCELKISPTAAGSLVMKYYNGKWDYGDYKGEVEKEFLHSIGEKFNLLREMNSSGPAGKNWRGKVPCLQNEKDGKKKIIGAKSPEDAYKKDLKKFGANNEIHIEVPASAICEYYIKKKCSYINIGSHGLFTLNNKDELQLNKSLKSNNLAAIPDFSSSATAMIRIRCQYKGSGSYQFVMTLQFSQVKKSPYNLAPLKSGSSSEIDEKVLKSDSILLAFS
jgi:hypothetical protein